MRYMILRWVFFIMGLMILALGIALTIKGKVFGIGPWDVFHYGLYLQLGLSIGSWSIIMGFILIIISSLYMKSIPKIGTLLNMLLLGSFIDLFNYLLPMPNGLLMKAFVFVLGIVLLGCGIGLYVSADLGAGPRDGVMLIIVEKTGLSIRFVRNGIEIIVFLLGWMLGGPVGIGTIVIAFLLGPIIGVTIPFSRSILKYLAQEKDIQSSL